ncbi:hypothetical protein SAMD00019534_110660 [Acytostelium subglobosum LB1]|uniref:hypothetical protein n=1 Tax=Acytostelium subglobosum LB1 TaxID=1410327 RepID=UPI000644951E|nr:hypothetical protein SAMD00019534_110660 [Acytostelium subglobosum LB1]GAM27890.1 hypothetical protein SAMD00019534_110660 [Acytostelium subglobosum LB1]|eukprot:XP_012749173.1 hypothetical protein SAMD00019534_110660 [Acytostelium subglobosum LB1]
MRQEAQVPIVQKTYYDELYILADSDKDGMIGLKDAGFFRKSALPDETLREIWQLADVKNGVLDIEDFIVALKLISLAQLGAPIQLDSIRAMPVVPPPKLQDVASIQFDWVVPPNEKNNYIDIFTKNDEDADGFINGDQAKVIFSASRLPSKLLGHIWFLSDMNGDQKLDCQEFIIATFLIRSLLKGYELPTRLPDSLIQSSRYISNAGVPSPKIPDWLIPPAERIIYEDVFNKNQQNGSINAMQAKGLFEKSGLPMQDLRQIWDLADYNHDQLFDKQKFVIAMFLISQRKKKKELPTTLPVVLLESSKSTFQPMSIVAQSPNVESQVSDAVKSGKYNFDLDDIVSKTTPVAGATPMSSQSGLVGEDDHSKSVTKSPVSMVSAVAPQATMPQQQLSAAAQFPITIPPPQQQQQQQLALPPQQQQAQPQSQQLQPSAQQAQFQNFQITQTKESIERVRQQTAEKDRLLNDLRKQFIEESNQSIEMNKALQVESLALDETLKQIHEHEEKLAAQRQSNIQIKERISSTRVDIKAANSQLDQITKMLKDKSAQYEEESESLAMLESDLGDKQQELVRYQKEVEALAKSIEALKQQKVERRQEMVQTNKAVVDAKADVKRLNEEFKQLKVQQTISPPTTTTTTTTSTTSPASVVKMSTDSFTSAPVTAPAQTESTDDGWSLFETIKVQTVTPVSSPIVEKSSTTTTTATTTTNPLKASGANSVQQPPATATSSNNNNFFFNDDKFNSFDNDQFSFSSTLPNPFNTTASDDSSSLSHKADAGSELSFTDHSNLFGNSTFGPASSSFDTFEAFQSANDPFGSLITNPGFSNQDTFIKSHSHVAAPSNQPSSSSTAATTTSTNNLFASEPITSSVVVTPNSKSDSVTKDNVADMFTTVVGTETVGFEDSFDDNFHVAAVVPSTEPTPFNTPFNSVTADDLFGSTPFGPVTTTSGNEQPNISAMAAANSSFFFDDTSFTERFSSNNVFATAFEDTSFNPTN